MILTNVSPDGTCVAIVEHDRYLRLLRVTDWGIVRMLALPSDGIHPIVFSPDGAIVWVGMHHRIMTWSTRAGTVLEETALSVRGVLGLAVSPDTQYLACAAEDGQVRVWEMLPQAPIV